MNTWLITGCSTGLGRALTEVVADSGNNVVATARDAQQLAPLTERYPDSVLALALDVTAPAEVTDAVRRAERRFGAVDVLVNNAGYGYRAAVEEGDELEVAQQFATNFFGPVAMIKAVLPGMRARRRGTIVNISSIGARVSAAGSGYYAASKAALEALTASLSKEVEPLGISAITVEPGAFRTDFAGRSLAGSTHVIPDYDQTAGPRRKQNDRAHGTQPGDPVKAAQAIVAAVESPERPGMLVLGPDAFGLFRQSLEALGAELERWEPISLSTNLGRSGDAVRE